MEKGQVWSHFARIRKDSSIESLQVPKASLGELEIDEILSIMRETGRIAHLMLRFCGIDDSLLRRLATGIKDDKVLTYIDLVGNTFSDDGMREFAQAIAVHGTMLTLDLGRNQVGVAGARALSEMLRRSQTIESLQLDYTGIDNGSAREIARGAAGCPSLKSLSLLGCPITGRGMRALAQLGADQDGISISGVSGQNAETGRIRVKSYLRAGGGAGKPHLTR